MINKASEVEEPEMADEVSELGNVVLFPGKTRNRPPQSVAEICREVQLNKTTRIEEITEIVVVQLFEDLFDNGYDFAERNDANKDMAFLIEAVKSIMCKHDGMFHHFHELAETYFVADELGDLTFIADEAHDIVVDLTKLDDIKLDDSEPEETGP